tara:strand:+ start:408 stop:557 length:150 start_codon:yes stop_codon:yes gene_type:complete
MNQGCHYVTQLGGMPRERKFEQTVTNVKKLYGQHPSSIQLKNLEGGYIC